MKYFHGLVLMCLATTLGGCGDDEASARARAIHLAPGVPNVDVYIDGSVVFANVPFENSTAYASFGVGLQRVELREVGKPDSAPLASATGLPAVADTDYTTAVFMNGTNEGVLAFVDDLSDPGEDNIRIRVINTANGIHEIDVWDVTDTDEPQRLFLDVDFGADSDPLVVSAGVYRLGLDFDRDHEMEVAFDVPELDAGTIANLFAVRIGDPFEVAESDVVYLVLQLANGTTTRIDPN